MNSKIVFPAEWATQSAVLMAWPHQNSDWAYMLDEVRACFSNIIKTIAQYEDVILLVSDKSTELELRQLFPKNVHIYIIPTNDTWARDFGPIFIEQNGRPFALDFKFNGWGLKYPADKDNLITKNLFDLGVFNSKPAYISRLSFVLEGGAIDSDGQGTLLTTSECQLSPNRNGGHSKIQIENYLKENLGLERILWLDHGYLAGDDTDSHVDTLARFCSNDTIAYVKCCDKDDEHFEALQRMEEQLKNMRRAEGSPYKLVPLPMPDKVIVDNQRLPATYANFLIINGAVLVPTYNCPKDEIALARLAEVFNDREIIGIDCNALIKQHGSLHCVTMQLPKGLTRELSNS